VDSLTEALLKAQPGIPRWAATEAAREAVSAERERLGEAAGTPLTEEELVARATRRAGVLGAPRPRRVVNATGIVLHTNLGRAPLAPGAAAAAAAAAASYGDLELDLESGRRGDRIAALARKLVLLTGAGGALVVNNNAAAVLLALNTLARGREVVVSRGELVEIGGSFRIPDIMQRAGVKLVEVGTTNRTHRADYEGAIGSETALLLKVHRSNFTLHGFVAEVELAELAEIGREHGLPVVEDLGSGTLVDPTRFGLPADAHATARLRQGADVVCFSGDKLLGGPQAGILLGAAEPVAAMRSNPWARALRLDKMSLAALDWTVTAHLEGRAETEIPVLCQLRATDQSLEKRARDLADRLARVAGDRAQIRVERDRAAVGGGSLPDLELDTWVVIVDASIGADRLAAGLRGASAPVLPRIRDENVLLDVRTLLAGDEARIEIAFSEALG
jgi:L-seryl-tRNA(Ser) seleniumtransferase